MAHRIGLLTAGGDVAGLNVCLKALVNDAEDRGYEVVGIRKGWEGLLNIDPASPSIADGQRDAADQEPGARHRSRAGLIPALQPGRSPGRVSPGRAAFLRPPKEPAMSRWT